MARKVEWTKAAIQDRFEIYRFWTEKNQTDTYSKKLEFLFKEAGQLIANFPEIGTETDFPGIRVKIVKNYKLFYKDHSDLITILRVWDSRQNPERLKLS